MKPDPSQFAKSVLWRLASIQAHVYQNQMLLVEVLARQTNKTVPEIGAQWKTECDTIRQQRYVELLRTAGFDDNSDSGQDDSLSRL